VITLDQALDRLLHRRSYREAFLAGRLDVLDLAPGDLAALATVDRAELARAAERVRDDLARRRHRGSGGLCALYPRTIEAWRAAHPDDADLARLFDAFLESGPFEGYRELPFAGPGLSLEEAFHLFCEAEGIGDAAAREHEFLTAMMKALLASPDPSFTLPDAIRPAARGHFAIGTRAGPVLYAALAGRLVTGPITPFLADLVLSDDPPEAIARRHGVTPEVLAASRRHLAALGLISMASATGAAG
jgi:hypothetical protein